MRQTIKVIETNMAYRRYLGFGFHTEVPHLSTFGKNYERRYHERGVFEDIFYHILKEIMDRGLLSADHVFVDSTHVKASAKEKHGMRWTTLRGLKKLSMQAMLTFAAMNLKKLATWTWQVA
jgi:transposase